MEIIRNDGSPVAGRNRDHCGIWRVHRHLVTDEMQHVFAFGTPQRPLCP
ncbi:MAG: hypothetical protein KF794_08355 [Xanthobacteraceae bacterium]|nr:MAG: hypothetical protein KF794_08355 [Xanthobacteraceae bacterium]